MAPRGGLAGRHGHLRGGCFSPCPPVHRAPRVPAGEGRQGGARAPAVRFTLQDYAALIAELGCREMPGGDSSMSGLTPTALYEFRRRLWGREFSLEMLAAAIPTSRPYLSQVLWGHWASPDTWQKIRAWVTPEEWAILLELEHCATWNKEQAALETAGARPWLMRRRCAKCQKWEGYEPCVGAQAHKITHGLCPSCYEREMELLSVALPRAHLVETEAGLAVHRSA